MFGIINYNLFIISAILLNLTPGADTLFILGCGMANGRKAGMVSALGISTGCMVHTVMAALGLSVILAKSALAFNIIKFLGAGYLIYLGIRSLISRDNLFAREGANEAQSLKKSFLQGITTNVLNPKVALFYLAFLPQFIDPGNPYGALPFLLLGFTFIATGTIWGITLAVFSSQMAAKLNPEGSNILQKISGLVFVGLGLNLLRAKLVN